MYTCSRYTVLVWVNKITKLTRGKWNKVTGIIKEWAFHLIWLLLLLIQKNIHRASQPSSWKDSLDTLRNSTSNSLLKLYFACAFEITKASSCLILLRGYVGRLHYATNRSSLKIGLIAIDKRQCRRGHESPLSGIEFPEKGDAVDVSPGRPEIPSIDEDTITMAHCGAPERSSSRPPTVKARVT